MISVIGSGNVDEASPEYEKARALGRRLVNEGYRVLSGGYGGIMEGASRGAREAENYREGDVIGVLKGLSRSEGNRYLDIRLSTGFGMARNQIVASSDCVVAIAGGAGTLSEMAFAWQLGRMLIAYRVPGWSGRLADTKIDDKRRIPLDDDRVYGVETEEEVISLLKERLDLYLH